MHACLIHAHIRHADPISLLYAAGCRVKGSAVMLSFAADVRVPSGAAMKILPPLHGKQELQRVDLPDAVTAVTAGHYHTLALTEAGGFLEMNHIVQGLPGLDINGRLLNSRC